MARNEIQTWFFDGLIWKLIPKPCRAFYLVGFDSGNVRRVETVIDGTQVGARCFDALRNAPEEVRAFAAVKETIELDAYVNTGR